MNTATNIGRAAGIRWAKRVRQATLLGVARASGVAHLHAIDAGKATVSDVLDYCQAFQNAAIDVLEGREVSA